MFFPMRTSWVLRTRSQVIVFTLVQWTDFYHWFPRDKCPLSKYKAGKDDHVHKTMKHAQIWLWNLVFWEEDTILARKHLYMWYLHQQVDCNPPWRACGSALVETQFFDFLLKPQRVFGWVGLNERKELGIEGVGLGGCSSLYSCVGGVWVGCADGFSRQRWRWRIQYDDEQMNDETNKFTTCTKR